MSSAARDRRRTKYFASKIRYLQFFFRILYHSIVTKEGSLIIGSNLGWKYHSGYREGVLEQSCKTCFADCMKRHSQRFELENLILNMFEAKRLTLV